MIREYVHQKMNHDIDSISGSYVLHKQVRLPFHDSEVLYIVGSAIVDKSCCGMWGCGFAIVPGFIISWESKIDNEGRYISEVEPISDQSIQKKLTQLIQDAEIVNQVQFW